MSKRQEQLEQELNDILPQGSNSEERQRLLHQKTTDLDNKKTASELARAKYKIQQAERIRHETAIAAQAKEELKEQKQQAVEEAIELLEEENPYPSAEEAIRMGNAVAVSKGQPMIAADTAKDIMMMQGTTRPEVVRLLTSLNVNLNLQLTKTDTANLLACLLTANETQLNAIYKNKKVPVAVKTVIKRLLDDAKLGNIDTVERLWDRLFGKTGMMLNLPEQTQVATGIIPNTPISREAYVIIRDTLIK